MGSALSVDLDRVLIKRMRKYNRGRADGEAADILVDELERPGFPRDRMGMHEHEMDAVRAALEWARSDDMLILPIHENRHAVLDFMPAQADSNSNTGELRSTSIGAQLADSI